MAVGFSPDGRLIAYRRWNAIVVRRVADRHVVVAVPTSVAADLSALAWSADGRSLDITAAENQD